MTRRAVVLVVVVTVLVSAAAGVGAWLLVRDAGAPPSQISLYSHGHLIRVGPYQYCNVLDLNDCQRPRRTGALPVTEGNPVQLSVPASIGRAPWRLLQVYADPVDTTTTVFRPDSRLAVTVPTVDPYRGRLTGLVVQLLTVVVFPDGELAGAPHAEWSVRMVWDGPGYPAP